MHYKPIENYGIIGNLNTIALVGMNGSVDFMCFPYIDSPTIFASILDIHKGGNFQIHPINKEVSYKQLYLPDTNVLLTRFLSTEGVGEITDFMPIEENSNGSNKIIRQVKSVRGKLTYELNCSPKFDYAKASHSIKIIHEKEVIFISNDKQDLKLRLRSTVPLTIDKDEVKAKFQLKIGETADFILESIEEVNVSNVSVESLVSDLLIKTVNYWKTWISHSQYKGRWKEVVNRSTLVLKLLISNKYGSVVASPTFSLPENINGNRNWDYRYVWIRDASFTIDVLLKLGYNKEAEAFIKWVEQECHDLGKAGHLSLIYTIDGRNKLEETTLSHFEGYRNSSPVRIGNLAYQQFQLDVYGELMQAVNFCDIQALPISYDFWMDLSNHIEWILNHWNEEDNGIWEIRAEKKDFLFSKLMCWVAIDCLIQIGNRHSFPISEKWIETRDKIHKTIYSEYWNEDKKSFVDIKGTETVDAALLLMPIVGFISDKDPKWLSTLKFIEEELVSDCLVYRYRHEKFEDGLKLGEGTFSVCSFWYVECLSRSGQIEKARDLFEKMLGYSNHLGLYSEQLGLKGEHLGNFPQGITHYGLINAAFDLNERLDLEGKISY